MCGIAGLVGGTDGGRGAERVDRMVHALRRRGPDSAGAESWPGAVLGHRRLAIFDLSPAGHQPMLTTDREVGLVFNGAIYNFLELRTELERRGCRFTSRTDTEVLLHGFREWGIDALVRRITGMFAFALWDARAERLYLVRDRLGVKPLCYVAHDGEIAFASTPRALRDAGLASAIDPQAVAEFLELGFITDRRSIYAGVTKVPAATIVEWSRGSLSSRSYWSPPSAADGTRLSFDEVVDETERLLLAATEKRLHADVPVGALLSGGVDSALVCWAARALGSDVTAYTVGTPDQAEDETADAVATARELGIEQRVLPMKDPSASDVALLVQAYPEPFGASSALGMLRVSEAIATSPAKVLLTGDGGDDVFLGYPRHRHLLHVQQVARWLPELSTGAWRAIRGVIPMAGPLRRGVHLIDYMTGGLGAFVSASDGLPFYHRRGLLGERLRDAMTEHRRIPWSVRSARRVLTEYLEHDLRTQFVAEYLTKVDGATMHYALEARSPFFDQALWEFAAALPYDVRLRGGELKAVLRALAARRIGTRVATGRKRGFGIPVEAWIAGSWRSAVEATFRDSHLAREGWVDAGAVLRELRATPEGGRAPTQLWYLFVLESWLREERTQGATGASRAA